MGKRDFVKRETKKPKKDAKKPQVSIIAPPVEVEVIKKRKKKEEWEEQTS